MYILSVNDISFSYDGKTVFKNFNMTVKSGEKVLLKGSNGSGKSTLLKLIYGLLRPLKGNIKYMDVKNPAVSQNLKRGLYMVGQNFNYVEDMTVEENLSLILDLSVRDIRKKKYYSRDFYKKKLSDLTLKEKKQLELKALYLRKADFILLDEAETLLDAQDKNDLRDFLKSDVSAIIVSHNEEFLKGIEFRIINLDGKVRESFEVPDFKGRGSIKGIYAKDEKSAFNFIKNNIKNSAVMPKDISSLMLFEEKVWKNIYMKELLRDFNIDEKKYIAMADKFIRERRLEFSSEDICDHLSGGNKLKLLLYRTLAEEKDVYILYDYKRGVDKASLNDINKIFARMKEEGKTIYLISEDISSFGDIEDEVIHI